MNKRLLQGISLVMALITIALASMQLWFGLDSPIYRPIELPRSAILDSNLRFFGGMGLGLALLLLWCIPRIESRTSIYQGVWFCAVLGGLGRLASVAVTGIPSRPLIVFTVIEVLGAPFLMYWQYSISRSPQHGA